MVKDQRAHQRGWAMARGEGADADAAVQRSSGPRTTAVGAAVVLIAVLIGGVGWLFLRGDATYVQATGVAVVGDGTAVQVDVTLPDDDCWVLHDDSEVQLMGTELLLDLRVEASDADCLGPTVTIDEFMGSQVPVGTPVDQVACDVKPSLCADDLVVTD